MAMTLRLSDEDEALLEQLARREKRSKTDVLTLALREHAERADTDDREQAAARRLQARQDYQRVLLEVIDRDAGLLDRLSR